MFTRAPWSLLLLVLGACDKGSDSAGSEGDTDTDTDSDTDTDADTAPTAPLPAPEVTPARTEPADDGLKPLREG